MKIVVNSKKVVAQAPYRVSLPKRAIVTQMSKSLEENDVIEKSSAEFANPIVLVKRKDGSDRLCVDYRRLNLIVEKENFPVPIIEEQLHQAKKYTFFTVLDLNSGYYQIPISPESRKYTAFITPDGLYEFKRMPFGLKNAPKVFQRVMAKIKEHVHEEDLMIYIDDILIGS